VGEKEKEKRTERGASRVPSGAEKKRNAEKLGDVEQLRTVTQMLGGESQSGKEG